MMYFIKITNMTSAIAPLVSLCNWLRQTLSRCSWFFDSILSKTPGTQTVKLAETQSILLYYFIKLRRTIKDLFIKLEEDSVVSDVRFSIVRVSFLIELAGIFSAKHQVIIDKNNERYFRERSVKIVKEGERQQLTRIESNEDERGWL